MGGLRPRRYRSILENEPERWRREESGAGRPARAVHQTVGVLRFRAMALTDPGRERFMSQQVRGRFWIEIAAATVSLVLLVLTFVWEEWIELLFGVSPDAGSGALEWSITGLTLALTIVFLALARVEWRRAAVQPA